MIHPCRSQVHTQLHNRHHCQSLLYYDSASSAAIPSRTNNLARLCSTKRHGHRHLEANHGLCGRGLSHSCCPQEREPLPLFFLCSKVFFIYIGIPVPELSPASVFTISLHLYPHWVIFPRITITSAYFTASPPLSLRGFHFTSCHVSHQCLGTSSNIFGSLKGVLP
jgi:hypothetical protein